MRPTLLIALVFLASVFLPSSSRGAETCDFVIVQPGQPGSPAEAEPVLDAFSDYLQKKLGPGTTVRGRYFNDLAEARQALKDERPAWGIVGLGVFAEYAGAWSLTPFASTRPGGFEKDQWRVLSASPAPGDWRQLKGPVAGTMLYSKAAACLLFGTPADRLPFTLTGTDAPLKALRGAASAPGGGAAVDRVQWQALQRLPLMGKLKVIHQSRDLPTSPVVWFGSPPPRGDRLGEVLRGMGEDPEAASLLGLLQTEGFGPPDPTLEKWRFSNEKECPR